MSDFIDTQKKPKEDPEEVIRRVGTYAPEAYEFLYRALAVTQQLFERDPTAKDEAKRHVSGKELLEGIRVLALNEFGYMARVVLEGWGIKKTDDFGRMVFALVESGHMSKRDTDSIDDFHEVYDFREAFDQQFRFS